MADLPTILLVDDEAPLLEEIQDFLGWSGFSVVPAIDGNRALAELAARKEITVVLTDIRMPFMDGLTLAAHIMKSRGDAEAIEVVLMTGHASVESAAEAVRAGAFDFLSKPMVLTEVVAVLQRAHAKAAARRAAYAARAAELSQAKADYAALQAKLGKSGSALNLVGDTPPELARILSHELRTPLIPLMALPDMLSDGKTLAAGTLNSCLREVRLAGQRLTEIADDLVELLAPPPARREMFRAVHPASVLRRAAALAEAAARRNSIALYVAPVPEGTVETDEAALLRVLARLLSNALAASPAGSTIELSAVPDSPDRLAFQVRDTGPGMSADEIALAMLPFHQLDMSLTRRTGGMGLGLPLAQRAMERLGGRLEILSQPGAGVTARAIVPWRNGS